MTGGAKHTQLTLWCLAYQKSKPISTKFPPSLQFVVCSNLHVRSLLMCNRPHCLMCLLSLICLLLSRFYQYINRSDYPAVTAAVLLLCPCRIWAEYKHSYYYYYYYYFSKEVHIRLL
eukprot:sb/3476533/